ncbi:MAG: GDP-mannose 4,6-dehydratase [Gemmatimonadetes bacterium]|nr:GDP-mannose 4,6-dehydratase [Gemmatimonadota bacterium]
MRVFVTGIDGFVGRHLAARLADDGHGVIGSSLSPGGAVQGAAEVVALDVTDAPATTRAIREAEPDAVVHLAGQTSVATAFEDPDATFQVNALGTLHVLEACREADAARVVVVSSSEVYGRREPEDGPVNESAPLAPITPYGTSKAAQDLLGHQYARGFGLPVIRVRAFPHTGPGQDPRFVFPSVARRIALAEAGAGPPTIRVGWLGAVRDLSDVRDVVGAYAALLERGQPGEAYNVCSGIGRTIGDALETLVGLAERPVTLERDEERLRPTEVEWIVGDPSKVEAATGWSPRIGWQETARDLLDDWRNRIGAEERQARV